MMNLNNYLHESILDDEDVVMASTEKDIIRQNIWDELVNHEIINPLIHSISILDIDNKGRVILTPKQYLELNFSVWGWMPDYIKDHGLLFGKKTYIIINRYSGKVSDLNIIDLKGGDILFKYSDIKLDKLPNNVKNLVFEFSSIRDLMTPLKKLNVKSISVDDDFMKSITCLWVKKITGKLPDVDTSYNQILFQL